MKSKKKLVFAVTSLCFVLLISIFSVGFIMAAINVAAKSGITVSYNAYNVDATATGFYFVSGKDKVDLYTDEAQTNTLVEFSPDEETGIEKSFQPTGEIDLAGAKPVYFHYTLTNRSSEEPIYMYLYTEINAMTNLNVYGEANTVDFAQNQLESKTSWGGLPEGKVYEIPSNGVLHIYLKFFVLDDTVDAYAEGGVAFTLSSMVL